MKSISLKIAALVIVFLVIQISKAEVGCAVHNGSTIEEVNNAFTTYKDTLSLKANERQKNNIVLVEGSDTPEGMVYVEGGTFTMGDTWGDGYKNEKPTHKVKLSSFYIGIYEVTHLEWKEIMRNDLAYLFNYYFPMSDTLPNNLPMVYVAYDWVLEFCNGKSIKEGLTPCYKIKSDGTDAFGIEVTCDFNANGYRLPTEAEWEYAARGGNKSKGYKYSGSNNPDEVAWYAKNSNGKMHPVGGKKPNELGIYDMSGNVWEGCWDYWRNDYPSSSVTNPKGAGSSLYRDIRGGSWFNKSWEVRVANRENRGGIRWMEYDLGFRLCRTE